MQVITDSVLSAKIDRLVDDKIRRSANGTWTVSKIPGWDAVPLRSGAHLIDTAIDGIISVLSVPNDTRLFAIAAEPVGEFDSVFEIEPTLSDLRQFNRDVGFLNYVLAATDMEAEILRWALLCSTDDFVVALG